MARLGDRAPQIVTALLAIAIAVELAFVVLGFLGSSGLGSVATPRGPAIPRPSRPALDVQSIVNAHLFGVAAPAATDSDDASNAPNTSMNLVLAGTIATDDPKHGLAIIGETAANAKVYSVGDALNAGATLHSVYADRVLLERGGTIEALALPRQQLAGGSRPSVTLPPPQTGVVNPQGAALAENVRRLVANDPGIVGELMRPQQVFQNGQMRGFRVYPGRNRAQFSKLGLQPGDLVTSVNGTPLDDPQRGAEIFRTIGSSPSVHVTIERNGRTQEITLNMSQAASQVQELEAASGSGSGMIPMNQVPQMPSDDSD
ncbi:MAG: type II secretion system protein GspC [Steroidobacterales bacterium]